MLASQTLPPDPVQSSTHDLRIEWIRKTLSPVLLTQENDNSLFDRCLEANTSTVKNFLDSTNPHSSIFFYKTHGLRDQVITQKVQVEDGTGENVQLLTVRAK